MRGHKGLLSHTERLKSRGNASNCGRFLCFKSIPLNSLQKNPFTDTLSNGQCLIKCASSAFKPCASVCYYILNAKRYKVMFLWFLRAMYTYWTFHENCAILTLSCIIRGFCFLCFRSWLMACVVWERKWRACCLGNYMSWFTTLFCEAPCFVMLWSQAQKCSVLSLRNKKKIYILEFMYKMYKMRENCCA